MPTTARGYRWVLAPVEALRSRAMVLLERPTHVVCPAEVVRKSLRDAGLDQDLDRLWAARNGAGRSVGR